MAIGDEGTLLALHAPGVLIWSSSDPAVVSVDAQGQVKALSKGSAVITASSGGSGASTTVKVYQTTGPNADPTTTALIDQALSLGTITAEQALTYRVFAMFGDERLPAPFDGAPEKGTDHLLLPQISVSINTLSQATQDILRPFLIPPIYAEGWYAKKHGLSAAAPAAASRLASAPNITINCTASGLPDFFRRVSTVHFDIHYRTWGDGFMDEATVKVVEAIASVIEEVYQAETLLLGRFPLSDLSEKCNGGNDRVDVYFVNYGAGGKGGQVTTYALPEELIAQNACAKRPSYMILNQLSREFFKAAAVPEGARLLVKSIVAHEFLHVLQFAMDRAASCADTEWFDEATAQWVIDHVVPSIPQGVPGEFGYEDGFQKVDATKKRSGSILANYLYSDHMRSIEKRGANPLENGYADYLFFQYLARKHTPATIKQIFDAMAAGQNSVEAIASVIDMKAVWPEFAKTLWNDWENKVLDDWHNLDEYDFGLFHVFTQTSAAATESASPDKFRPIAIDQKGERRAKFTLLENALDEFSGNYYEIPQRSMFYEYLKFTDPSVHSVLFFNPIATLPSNEFMKLQVLKKIGGAWSAAEDWTMEPYKSFCLDKKDERLEELLIIVSNSEVNRAADEPVRIPKQFPMQLSTSNVGCWRWQGTASTRITIADPVNNTVATASAIVQFEAVPTQIPGRITFETSAGVVNGVQTGTIGTPMGTCTIDLFAADTPIVKKTPPDGTIDINLDLDIGFGLPPDRNLITLAGNSILSTRQRLICPSGTETTTVDMSWNWFQVDDLNSREVSADGQKIEGEFNQSNPAINTTIRTLFNFSALRE